MHQLFITGKTIYSQVDQDRSIEVSKLIFLPMTKLQNQKKTKEKNCFGMKIRSTDDKFLAYISLKPALLF